MRLVSVIDSLAPGGAERSLVELVPHLARHGIHPHVCVLHDRPGFTSELVAQGIPVTVVGTGAGAVVRVARLARRAEVLHTTLYGADLVGRVAGLLTGTPVVCTLANERYTPEQFAEPGLSARRLRLARALDRLSARSVTRFHAVSDPVATQMARALRVSGARVVVIPRGRDPRRLPPADPARRRGLRTALGWEAGPVVLAVARHEHQKGLDVLLDALDTLRRSHPTARVVVAGSPGRATAALGERAAALGPDAVHLLGARPDVADLLAAADVAVLPSRREGFPGAALEAMAVGVPLVASDLATVRAAVGNPPTARLVPAGDPAAWAAAVAWVLDEPEAAAELAARARARFLAEFTTEAVAGRMADLFWSAAR